MLGWSLFSLLYRGVLVSLPGRGRELIKCSRTGQSPVIFESAHYPYYWEGCYNISQIRKLGLTAGHHMANNWSWVGI